MNEADRNRRTFRDHFSGTSREYAAHRPDYPDALYSTLAALAPARRLAWDCGTGTGQAALGLARYFDRVIATDASREQLGAAAPHDRIEYRIAPAEESGLPDRSVDLATAAQALHWFDLDRYRLEVERVLVPGGVLAVWGYGLSRIAPAVDEVMERYYAADVGDYWPPERRLIEERYATISFPFPELETEEFEIEREMTIAELGGYVRTWSATQRYVRDRGSDPAARLETDLAAVWGATERRRVVWPIFLRAFRKP